MKVLTTWNKYQNLRSLWICSTRRKSHRQFSHYLCVSGGRGNELLDFDCPLLIILQIWQFFNLFGPLLFQTNEEGILQFKKSNSLSQWSMLQDYHVCDISFDIEHVFLNTWLCAVQGNSTLCPRSTVTLASSWSGEPPVGKTRQRRRRGGRRCRPPGWRCLWP